MKIYQKTALVIFLTASMVGCGDKKAAPQKPAKQQVPKASSSKSKPTKEQVQQALLACQQGFAKFISNEKMGHPSPSQELAELKAFQTIAEKQCAIAANAGQQQAYMPYAGYQEMLTNGFFNMTVKDLEKMKHSQVDLIFSQPACHWAMKSLFPSKFDDSQVKGDYRAFVIGFLKKNGPELFKQLGRSGIPRIETAVGLCGNEVASSILQTTSGLPPIIVRGGSGTKTTPKTPSPKQPNKKAQVGSQCHPTPKEEKGIEKCLGFMNDEERLSNDRDKSEQEVKFENMKTIMKQYDQNKAMCKDAVKHCSSSKVNLMIGGGEVMKAIGFNSSMTFDQFKRLMYHTPDKEIAKRSYTPEGCYYFTRYAFGHGVRLPAEFKKLLRNKANQKKLKTQSDLSNGDIFLACGSPNSQAIIKALD
jgi:hypothetical protein